MAFFCICDNPNCRKKAIPEMLSIRGSYLYGKPKGWLRQYRRKGKFLDFCSPGCERDYQVNPKEQIKIFGGI